jgi:hypothetical protein
MMDISTLDRNDFSFVRRWRWLFPVMGLVCILEIVGRVVGILRGDMMYRAVTWRSSFHTFADLIGSIMCLWLWKATRGLTTMRMDRAEVAENG